MGIEWFYVRDGQQRGPVPISQLKQLATGGQLRPTDLVWRDGMPEKVPAQSVKGLFASCVPAAVAQAPRAPSTSARPAAPTPRQPLAAAPAAAPQITPGSSSRHLLVTATCVGIAVVGTAAATVYFLGLRGGSTPSQDSSAAQTDASPPPAGGPNQGGPAANQPPPADQEDTQTLIAELERKAAQGSAASQVRLGRLYYEGTAIEQDHYLARNWFEKAVEQKYPEAYFHLAQMHARGEGGLTRDPLACKTALETAAQLGYEPASDELTAMEESERNIPQADLAQYVAVGSHSLSYDESTFGGQERAVSQTVDPIFGPPYVETTVVKDQEYEIINGVTITCNIGNTLLFRSIDVRVRVQARSEEVVNEALAGSLRYGGKEIDDSFTMTVPPGGGSFSVYYDLRTEIETTGLGGLGVIAAQLDGAGNRYGSLLESAPAISVELP
jgi:hypothetical protein